MIGSLMYLTSSRPDLGFLVCMCARYQARPTKKYLHAVKWIFRYLKGTTNMGFWYSKDTNIALTAYADADHARCQDTRRSTSGSAQFLGDRLTVQEKLEMLCWWEDKRDRLQTAYADNLTRNQRDLPRDIPLDRIEVLRYDTKGVKVSKGIIQTKTELTLEQTQQGVSDEVLVSIEGVKE
ncbi:hypothetical protein Tco_1028359 [Tanacetum coccineum]|uniref:Reverse transcriptase Ty1/copia-type domain-containing protein n=1 Tax=Tanacetum coccineum TaxID=301880 RepID=A0ABQ5G0E9_9ASTR